MTSPPHHQWSIPIPSSGGTSSAPSSLIEIKTPGVNRTGTAAGTDTAPLAGNSTSGEDMITSLGQQSQQQAKPSVESVAETLHYGGRRDVEVGDFIIYVEHDPPESSFEAENLYLRRHDANAGANTATPGSLNLAPSAGTIPSGEFGCSSEPMGNKSRRGWRLGKVLSVTTKSHQSPQQSQQLHQQRLAAIDGSEVSIVVAKYKLVPGLHVAVDELVPSTHYYRHTLSYQVRHHPPQHSSVALVDSHDSSGVAFSGGGFTASQGSSGPTPTPAVALKNKDNTFVRRLLEELDAQPASPTSATKPTAPTAAVRDPTMMQKSSTSPKESVSFRRKGSVQHQEGQSKVSSFRQRVSPLPSKLRAGGGTGIPSSGAVPSPLPNPPDTPSHQSASGNPACERLFTSAASFAFATVSTSIPKQTADRLEVSHFCFIPAFETPLPTSSSVSVLDREPPGGGGQGAQLSMRATSESLLLPQASSSFGSPSGSSSSVSPRQQVQQQQHRDSSSSASGTLGGGGGGGVKPISSSSASGTTMLTPHGIRRTSATGTDTQEGTDAASGSAPHKQVPKPHQPKTATITLNDVLLRRLPSNVVELLVAPVVKESSSRKDRNMSPRKPRDRRLSTVARGGRYNPLGSASISGSTKGPGMLGGSTNPSSPAVVAGKRIARIDKEKEKAGVVFFLPRPFVACLPALVASLDSLKQWSPKKDAGALSSSAHSTLSSSLAVGDNFHFRGRLLSGLSTSLGLSGPSPTASVRPSLIDDSTKGGDKTSLGGRPPLAGHTTTGPTAGGLTAYSGVPIVSTPPSAEFSHSADHSQMGKGSLSGLIPMEGNIAISLTAPTDNNGDHANNAEPLRDLDDVTRTQTLVLSPKASTRTCAPSQAQGQGPVIDPTELASWSCETLLELTKTIPRQETVSYASSTDHHSNAIPTNVELSSARAVGGEETAAPSAPYHSPVSETKTKQVPVWCGTACYDSSDNELSLYRLGETTSSVALSQLLLSGDDEAEASKCVTTEETSSPSVATAKSSWMLGRSHSAVSATVESLNISFFPWEAVTGDWRVLADCLATEFATLSSFSLWQLTHPEFLSGTEGSPTGGEMSSTPDGFLMSILSISSNASSFRSTSTVTASLLVEGSSMVLEALCFRLEEPDYLKQIRSTSLRSTESAISSTLRAVALNHLRLTDEQLLSEHEQPHKSEKTELDESTTTERRTNQWLQSSPPMSTEGGRDRNSSFIYLAATNLTELDLSHNLLGESLCQYLKEVVFPSDSMTLRTLRLGNNPIGPKGAYCLSQGLRVMPRLSPLVFLDLTNVSTGPKLLAEHFEPCCAPAQQPPWKPTHHKRAELRQRKRAKLIALCMSFSKEKHLQFRKDRSASKAGSWAPAGLPLNERANMAVVEQVLSFQSLYYREHPLRIAY